MVVAENHPEHKLQVLPDHIIFFCKTSSLTLEFNLIYVLEKYHLHTLPVTSQSIACIKLFPKCLQKMIIL